MKPLYRLLMIFMLSSLLGCQTTSQQAQQRSLQLDPYTAFHDDIFPDYESVQVESPPRIFALDTSAKNFVKEKIAFAEQPAEKIQSLIKGIFDHAELNLLYDNDANTIAKETFANRAANCLSLTIMTFAMADFAGIPVRFQQIDIPEYWERKGGYSMLNGHINLRLYAQETLPARKVAFARGVRSFELDFDRRARPQKLPTQEIDQQRVLAMFYNNKGVDELINKEYTRAYAYFRQALIQDAAFAPAWSNLGLIYRLNDQLVYAEYNYDQALKINEKDSTTLENLAYLYSITDRQQQANEITARLDRQRQSNPNYHFMLGQVAFEDGQYSQAIKHFHTAIKLDGEQHMFYFGMAQSYFKLGDVDRSHKYMKLAKRHAIDDSSEMFYQSKIERLTSL